MSSLENDNIIYTLSARQTDVQEIINLEGIFLPQNRISQKLAGIGKS